MSTHYFLNCSIIFNQKILADDIKVIEFLFEDGSEPKKLPTHSYFNEPERMYSIFKSYKNSNFEAGEYTCNCWKTQQTDVEGISGINIALPSIKDTQGWWESLLLLDWLCSLGCKNGFIGYIKKEEEINFTTLLYSFNESLYFYDEKEFGKYTSILNGESLKL